MSQNNRMERWGQIASTSVKPSLTETKVGDSVVIKLNPEELEHRKRANAVQSDLRIADLYLQKSRNAKSANQSFGLTYIEFYQLMATPICAYSGKTFSMDPQSPYSMSMERINPQIGYTPENTIAVTKAANTEKSRLDAFIKGEEIPPEMKIKLLNKAVYQMQKQLKIKKG